MHIETLNVLEMHDFEIGEVSGHSGL